VREAANAKLTKLIEDSVRHPIVADAPDPASPAEAKTDLAMELAAVRAEHEATKAELTELRERTTAERVELQRAIDDAAIELNSAVAEGYAMRERLDSANHGLDALQTDLRELTAKHAAEKVELESRLKAAERAFAQEKVQQLVGKKLLPAEVPSCVEDFLRDRKSFEERIAMRADLRMTERVIQPERLDALPVAPADPCATGSARIREKAQKSYHAR
jgi:chromosome segregation ATPase